MFDVVFVDAPTRGIFDTPLKGFLQMAAQAAKVKVKVLHPYRVVLDGKPHTDGDMLTVPEKVAA